MKNTKRDLLLKRISNYLITNASGLSNLGLYYGKIGVVIFFFHYARYSGNLIYENFAYELLEEIYEDIEENESINFESGLCGIGWSFIYLIENKFVNGNPNEILKELDYKVIGYDFLSMPDLSINTGMKGVLLYLKKRLDFSIKNLMPLPFNESFLKELKYWIVRFEIMEDWSVYNLLINTCSIENELNDDSLGLYGGYSGYGLKIILDYEKNIFVR